MVLRLQCPKCGYTGEVTKKVKEDERYEYYECPTCRTTPHVWKVKGKKLSLRRASSLLNIFLLFDVNLSAFKT